MSGGVITIKAGLESDALPDRQVQFQFVTTAGARIRSAAVRLPSGGAIQEFTQLTETQRRSACRWPDRSAFLNYFCEGRIGSLQNVNVGSVKGNPVTRFTLSLQVFWLASRWPPAPIAIYVPPGPASGVEEQIVNLPVIRAHGRLLSSRNVHRDNSAGVRQNRQNHFRVGVPQSRPRQNIRRACWRHEGNSERDRISIMQQHFGSRQRRFQDEIPIVSPHQDK